MTPFSRVTKPQSNIAPHPSANIEWWYCYAFLQGSSGRRYAMMTSFFLVGETDFFKGHYLIYSFLSMDDNTFTPASYLDTRLQKHLLALYLPFKLILQPTDSDTWKLFGGLLAGQLPHPHKRMKQASVHTDPAVKLQYSPACASFDPSNDGTFSLDLAGPEPIIELTFKPAKQVMLLDETGTINGLTYASSARNRVSGDILVNVNGRREHVTGEGWFDHQWGRNHDLLLGMGWSWFGLLLDDGRELLISQRRAAQSEGGGATAVLIEKDHSRRSAGLLKLTPTRYWKSLHTGVRYPVEWHIDIPGFWMKLRVEPVMNKQEMPIIGPLQAIWEGAVRVTGEQISPGGARQPIAGKGFMELVGYGAT